MQALTWIGLFGAVVTSGSPKSSGTSALVGTWKLQISDEVRDVSRKIGMPEPQAKFVFNQDGTFGYVSNGAAGSFAGTYAVSDQGVKLSSTNSRWPNNTQLARLSNDKLDVDGLKYLRDASVAPSETLGSHYILRAGSALDPTNKIEFRSDGTFAFTGHGVTSNGKYTVNGSQLTLQWTEVDGLKPEPAGLRKTVSLAPDGSITIDTYHWEKAS